ncbi:hypothetical protein LOTGIDRAFT_232977 [Lottia gigantea]|uniref:Leucine-rich repeat-containing protein 63 n=1 Tax=Lottia gigantea TaxID=225164 RepID=V3ZNH6_LOTGI|nr:hypothetical protein LOTGIDRAFT_232977 [Lottia gigantea]ESO92913.1 hypothetical protein LOTGIDRAFT_232977 [Lottia gigantea]
MAAPSKNNFLSSTDIPGLTSHKNVGTKLLRRPRAPKPSSPPNSSSSPVRFQEPTEDSSPEKYYPDTSEIESRTESHSVEYTNRYSPVSPPPPSETISNRLSFPAGTYTSRESHVTSFLTRDNTKYILDPVFRGRTSLGTYVDGKSLVKPFKTRGPDPFPLRQTKQFPPVFQDCSLDDDYYHTPPAFTLEHFLTVSKKERLPLIRVKQIMYSTHNYKKLTKLLAAKFIHRVKSGVTRASNKILTPESQKIPAYEPRVPQKQLLIEMAAMIKKHVRDMTDTEVKTLIKPMPKFTSLNGKEMVPHTEIILYEDRSTDRINLHNKNKQSSELPEQEAVFHSARSQYFQGSVRSKSPFTVAGEGTITPSELAILDALISGGSALSLKAHFISELPDIAPMVKTITYLNLSFNDFTSVPEEVLDIHQLQIFKMRNNPLLVLPDDIDRLCCLRTLVVSFCLISTIPNSLYKLQTLEHVNLSYNKLTSISNDIKYMKNLVELNIEGNQLPAMPCGALTLNLQYLNVKNNFMHPLFWKEHTDNMPQTLCDLSVLCLYKSERYQLKDLPDSVQTLYKKAGKCDCCHQAMFGQGIKIIRPVSKIYGIKNLPFIFRACSLSCLKFFNENTESLSSILYGDD